jgi:uncharacterized protein
MQDDEFEWDEKKAEENYAKHGIDFEHAKLVFNDLFSVEGFDDGGSYGEDRFTIIGMAEGVILFVVYTERAQRIRLISARRATRHEQNDYYQQNI